MSKLYFRYGAMNSGKTTLLLQVAHNYEERDMKVVIIKPGVDTKGEDNIVTRIGLYYSVELSDVLTDKRASKGKPVPKIGACQPLVVYCARR